LVSAALIGSGHAGTPRVGVLAVQGGVAEHLAALAAAGADAVPVRRPVELAGVDGLVLPGGESTTIGRLLVAFDLMEPLRAAVADGLPVYGSCAGMILLARDVLDGRPDQPTLGVLDVTVRRNAFGRQVQSAEADLAFAAIRHPDRPVHAVFIRAPWVERVGAGVDVLARVPAGDAAGRVVAVRSGALLATAFHPELTGDTRVHELFVAMVAAARA
jgi:5'-phosphate synthase pdxT subunit